MVSPFSTGSGASSSLQLSDGKGLVILKGHAAVQSYTVLINAVDGADRLSECEQNQSQKFDGGGLSRLPVQLLASGPRLITDPHDRRGIGIARCGRDPFPPRGSRPGHRNAGSKAAVQSARQAHVENQGLGLLPRCPPYIPSTTS